MEDFEDYIGLGILTNLRKTLEFFGLFKNTMLTKIGINIINQIVNYSKFKLYDYNLNHIPKRDIYIFLCKFITNRIDKLNIEHLNIEGLKSLISYFIVIYNNKDYFNDYITIDNNNNNNKSKFIIGNTNYIPKINIINYNNSNTELLVYYTDKLLNIKDKIFSLYPELLIILYLHPIIISNLVVKNVGKFGSFLEIGENLRFENLVFKLENMDICLLEYHEYLNIEDSYRKSNFIRDLEKYYNGYKYYNYISVNNYNKIESIEIELIKQYIVLSINKIEMNFLVNGDKKLEDRLVNLYENLKCMSISEIMNKYVR